MGKKISIAEASRLTGVAINTLKTWDNTDGKFKSSFRTSGGHRRYDLGDEDHDAVRADSVDKGAD